MNPDDLRQKIELQVVELVKAKLADGTLTEDRAQAMSQMVLDLLKPGMSFEELYRAVPKLDDTYPELAPVVAPIVKDYEDNVVAQARQGMSDLIRQGQYDAASKLGKKVIGGEVTLEWQGISQPPKPSQT